MKPISKYSLVFLVAALFISCSESRKKATEKFNELNEQVDRLNTTLNEGIKKIESVDSIIGAETEQLKEIDSLIKKTSIKIDSMATEKMET